MDPQVVFLSFREACKLNDADEAHRAASDYNAWVANGGFLAIDGEDRDVLRLDAESRSYRVAFDDLDCTVDIPLLPRQPGAFEMVRWPIDSAGHRWWVVRNTKGRGYFPLAEFGASSEDKARAKQFLATLHDAERVARQRVVEEGIAMQVLVVCDNCETGTCERTVQVLPVREDTPKNATVAIVCAPG